MDVINDRVLGYLARFRVALGVRPVGSSRWGRVHETVWARDADEAARVAAVIGAARNPRWTVIEWYSSALEQG